MNYDQTLWNELWHNGLFSVKLKYNQIYIMSVGDHALNYGNKYYL